MNNVIALLIIVVLAFGVFFATTETFAEWVANRRFQRSIREDGRLEQFETNIRCLEVLDSAVEYNIPPSWVEGEDYWFKDGVLVISSEIAGGL